MKAHVSKETGSLVNHLLSGTRGEPTPAVGMGATILMWSDRHAATIVKVTPTTVHVQQDIAKRTDANGLSENQTYEFSRDPGAPVQIFRKTKGGAWRRTGGGCGLRIGDRNEYSDPSF